MRSGRSVAPSLVGLGGRDAPLFLPLLARPAFSVCALARRAPLHRRAPRLCFGFCAPPFAFVAATRSPSPFARLRRVGGALAYGLPTCLRAPAYGLPTCLRTPDLPTGSQLITSSGSTGSLRAPSLRTPTRGGSPAPAPPRLPLLNINAPCSSGGGARALRCASLYPSSIERFASRRRGCAPSPRTPSPRGWRNVRGRRAR